MTENITHRALALVGAILALAGCASRGNEVLKEQDPATVDRYVVDGTTTRDQVQNIYGAPVKTSFLSEKNEVWTYQWSRATAQGQNFIPVVGALMRGYDVRRKELVIVFDERNIVARHTMTDNNDAISTGLIDTGGAPKANSTVTAARISSTNNVASATEDSRAPSNHGAKQAAAQSARSNSGGSRLLEPGVWVCGIDNYSNQTNAHYTIQFAIADDHSITVGSYGNAPATIVATDPLKFTALNPRGSRVITFLLKADNSMVVTGPNTNNPDLRFYNAGSCVRS